MAETSSPPEQNGEAHQKNVKKFLDLAKRYLPIMSGQSKEDVISFLKDTSGHGQIDQQDLQKLKRKVISSVHEHLKTHGEKGVHPAFQKPGEHGISRIKLDPTQVEPNIKNGVLSIPLPSRSDSRGVVMRHMLKESLDKHITERGKKTRHFIEKYKNLFPALKNTEIQDSGQSQLNHPRGFLKEHISKFLGSNPDSVISTNKLRQHGISRVKLNPNITTATISKGVLHIPPPADTDIGGSATRKHLEEIVGKHAKEREQIGRVFKANKIEVPDGTTDHHAHLITHIKDYIKDNVHPGQQSSIKRIKISSRLQPGTHTIKNDELTLPLNFKNTQPQPQPQPQSLPASPPTTSST